MLATTLRRREFIGAAAAALLLTGCRIPMEELDQAKLYGVIGQMMAVAGKREELIGYLLAGSAEMPGNLGYAIFRDLGDENAIWITEVWESAEAHQASLKLPQVQAAIASARPIIAGFGTRAEVEPVAASKH